MAPTQDDNQRLSRLYGINRTPMTAQIPGVQFPDSFPFDFMHLLENTFKNYVNYFSGNFKQLNAGKESYILPEAKWKAIGAATLTANETIPSTFGRRIPNIAEDRTFMTAEGYLVWSTLYAPILLADAFSDQKYYKHFMRLISIVERLLAFTSTASERQKLREDIVVWYEEYEEIFYQYDAERLATCLMTVHAWLHLVDFIERSGPLWAYWCWVMERLCSVLSRSIGSKKHPYASLNRRIIELATLASIRNRYDLQELLPHHSRMHNTRPLSRFTSEAYPDHVLVGPHQTISLHSDTTSLARRVAAHLATQIEPKPSDSLVLRLLPPTFEQWAKVQIDEGDLAWTLQGYRRRAGERDRSYVQYSQLVDKRARHRNAPPEFEKRVSFGRLERAFVVQLPANAILRQVAPTTKILLEISPCDTSIDPVTGFYRFRSLRAREVIDADCLEATVGRIESGGDWYIVRRAGVLEHSEFDSDK
ncbi:hypothetical protein FRB99_004073 [Tulasnella sp. 403]|nr:hypothetical protein FRB99_004073 [Tulasnella sp. 403]